MDRSDRHNRPGQRLTNSQKRPQSPTHGEKRCLPTHVPERSARAVPGRQFRWQTDQVLGRLDLLWVGLAVVAQADIVRVTTGLRSLFQPDQFNYAFLMNVDAQVHLHVIPRYAAPRTWRGREFTDAHWGRPFGTDQVALPSEDLTALAADLRAVFAESV